MCEYASREVRAHWLKYGVSEKNRPKRAMRPDRCAQGSEGPSPKRTVQRDKNGNRRREDGTGWRWERYCKRTSLFWRQRQAGTGSAPSQRAPRRSARAALRRNLRQTRAPCRRPDGDREGKLGARSAWSALGHFLKRGPDFLRLQIGKLILDGVALCKHWPQRHPRTCSPTRHPPLAVYAFRGIGPLAIRSRRRMRARPERLRLSLSESWLLQVGN